MHNQHLLLSAVLACATCLFSSTAAEAQMNGQPCINRPLPGMKEFLLANCCQCKGAACYCGRASGSADCNCNTACEIGEKLKSYRNSKAAKTFTLESGLVISGRLFDFKQRPHEEPLSGFEVRLVLPSGEVRRTRTDKTGTFRVLLEAFEPTTARFVDKSVTMDLGDVFFNPERGTSNEQNYYFLAIAPAEISGGVH
jgi:hypothetical protein